MLQVIDDCILRSNWCISQPLKMLLLETWYEIICHFFYCIWWRLKEPFVFKLLHLEKPRLSSSSLSMSKIRTHFETSKILPVYKVKVDLWGQFLGLKVSTCTLNSLMGISVDGPPGKKFDFLLVLNKWTEKTFFVAHNDFKYSIAHDYNYVIIIWFVKTKVYWLWYSSSHSGLMRLNIFFLLHYSTHFFVFMILKFENYPPK